MESAEKAVINLALGVEQIKKSNQNLAMQGRNIRTALVELKKATTSLEAKLIYTTSQEIPPRITRIKDPKQRIEELQKLIPSDLEDSKLQLGQIYLPKSKTEEAYMAFSNDDMSSQSKFLRDNLKIWNNSEHMYE